MRWRTKNDKYQVWTAAADRSRLQKNAIYQKIEKNLELFLYFWMTAHYFPTAAEKSILQKNGENAAAHRCYMV